MPAGVERSPQLAAAREFAGQVEAHRWSGGIRIVLQGAMRAPVGPHGVTLEARWRVDVFTEPKSRRPAFTLVAETPAAALRDLAALLDGEASVAE